ncbi:hypothetical protein AAMO2058_000367700 [Amorphochlora amoebiformis]|mmetsp:Transcript_17316/g.27534  ORF Transcript_17316/g.27534 Transcript_17316/m.27534 type:complete len:370 (-) Transcript_17316:121-1230(-)
MSDLLDAFERLVEEEERSIRENQFRPEDPLWETLQEHIKPAEKQAIKTKIGEKVIEKNLLLYSEAVNVADILQSVKTENQAARKRLNSYVKIAEKPRHKILRACIQQKMEALIHHLKKEGREDEIHRIVQPQTEDLKSAVSYSLQELNIPVEDPLSSRRKRNKGKKSAENNGKSLKSSTSALRENIDVWTVDDKVDDIRKALVEETLALESEIAYLRATLAQETKFHLEVKSGTAEVLPKISDLERLGSSLDLELNRQLSLSQRNSQSDRRPQARKNRKPLSLTTSARDIRGSRKGESRPATSHTNNGTRATRNRKSAVPKPGTSRDSRIRSRLMQARSFAHQGEANLDAKRKMQGKPKPKSKKKAQRM